MERAVLIVAGLDPSGGAGLVADVATVAARGLRPLSVASALTLQDSRSCDAIVPCDAALVAQQIGRLIDDLPIAAVKIGMLGTQAVAEQVCAALAPLAARDVPIVVDPVLRASAGVALFEGDAARIYRNFARSSTVLTPNRDEAALLLGATIGDAPNERHAAAEQLRTWGFGAVLLKGGHFSDDRVTDLWCDANGALALSSPRASHNVRGTGCALATELACALAVGKTPRDAARIVHARVARRIAAATPVGRGARFLALASEEDGR